VAATLGGTTVASRSDRLSTGAPAVGAGANALLSVMNFLHPYRRTIAKAHCGAAISRNQS
jgi:hypothetical protein